MNAKKKIEELLEASEDGTITAAQVTEAGLHRNVCRNFCFFAHYNLLIINFQSATVFR